MRKLNEELENALKIDVWKEEVQTHKGQVLNAVRHTRSMQRTGKRIGFFEFLLRQIPFAGRELRMTQGFAAAVMFGILYLSIGGDVKYLSIRHIPLLFGILAIVLVMTSIPLMLRPYQYRMHEIEMAARISLPRLLTANLVILTAEYLAVFVFCIGMSAGMAGVSAVRAALYFTFPLLAAGTGCVQIIRRTADWDESAQRVRVCEGFCVCLAAVLIVLTRVRPVVYDHIGVWAILVFCTFPLFAISIRMWVRESGNVSDKTSVIDII